MAHQRLANVKGALEVPPRQRPHVEGGLVPLVDGVITSGTTVSAATVHSPINAGAVSVNVLALEPVTETTAMLNA